LPPWWQPQSLDVDVGSIGAGSLDDVHEDDGVRLDITETTGAPGFDTVWYFYNVPDDQLQLTFNGYYDGNAGHYVKLYQWNFTLSQWDAVTGNSGDFSDETSDQDYEFSLLSPNSDYISSGELRLRIIHSSPGNINHTFYVDLLRLDYDDSFQKDDLILEWFLEPPESLDQCNKTATISIETKTITFTVNEKTVEPSTNGVVKTITVTTRDKTITPSIDNKTLDICV